MTRSDRTFPVGPRLLALGAAIVALLVSVPMAGASTPSPSKSQVQSAHQAYVDAQARISQYRSEIESVQAQFPTQEFEHDVRPLWGRTPFNSWLLAFRRRP